MNSGELFDRLDAWDRLIARSREDEHLDTGDALEVGDDLAKSVRDLLSNRENVQALSLARLMRDRPGQEVQIELIVFDLPDGYWRVIFDNSSFECGIAPNGDVSS